MDNSPTKTGAERRHGPRRDEIVKASIGLFQTKGPHGTGIAEICSAAGTTKGVFSHHFPGGKDELIAAVVARNGRDVKVVLDHLLADGSVTSAVEAVFEFYASRLDNDPDVGCPIAAAVVDSSSMSDSIRAAADASFEQWRELLSDAISAGGLSRQRSNDLAHTAIAAMEGALLVARAQRDPDVLRSTGRLIVELIQA